MAGTEVRYDQHFPVDAIHPREDETRIRSQQGREALTAMVQQLGWIEPILLDGDHRIVDGQLRYEIAVELGAETMPALVNPAMSADDAVIYQMLSKGVQAFDQWNPDAVNRVLAAASAKDRALAESLGFFQTGKPVRLRATENTLDLLGRLFEKQLGNDLSLDPVQLLYVEALRSKVQEVREELVARGEDAGDVRAKLKAHLDEESAQQKAGRRLAADKGWSWVFNDDGTVHHPAYPRFRFEIADAPPVPEPVEEVFRDGPARKISRSQFQLISRTHFGLDPEAANDLYDSGGPLGFNARLKKYSKLGLTVAPNHSGPATEEEIQAQQERLDLWKSVL